MRRIGLVGTGLMGNHHWWALDALRAAGLTDAVVTAAYDLDPDSAARFAAETGVALAPNLDSLVASSDIVWICTWTAGHLPVARAAAAAGRPVFVEKPMAPSLEEC
jgi:myo-inositol 2-dehydrogenase/D-chiro-inositol 1-dehydrogenase